MEKELVLKTCYSILRRTTPLSFDCGYLCKGKCCNGDSETGMLLFPGEEKLIDKNIKIITTKNGNKLAVCSGICDRNKRPLACRIYPLFPLIVSEEGKGIIRVVSDYRADCPLIQGNFKFNKRFIKGIKRIGKFLLLNEETSDYLKQLSKEFNDYYQLKEKFFK